MVSSAQYARQGSDLKKECAHSHALCVIHHEPCICIFFAVTFYCLHMLRNLTVVYAIIPPIFCVMVVAACSKFKKKFNLNGVFLIGLFFCFYGLPLACSFVFYPDENYIVSFMRYLYVVPFAFFCFFIVNKAEYVFFALKIYMFFIIFSALSLIYQVFYGPIEWLADASERGGMVRFASLSGSLTAYGIYFCFCMPFLFFHYRANLALKFSFFLLIIVGVLVSLQKAGIANLIVLFFLFFIFCDRLSRLKLLSMTLVVALILFASDIVMNGYIYSSVSSFFRIGENENIDDVIVYQSILDRMWELPSVLFDRYGWKGLFFGVGLVGGSGTFGFSDYPMSHNGFFDLLFLGGIAYLLVFLSVFSYALFNAYWSYRMRSGIDRDLGLVSVCIMILFLVNFLFAGALFYQPYGGVIFYLILLYYTVHFRRKTNKIEGRLGYV